MAILDILTFPDIRLRTIAEPVAEVNEEIQTIVDDMIDTMYAAQGVGLAATQVNIHKRIVVIDTSEEHDQPLVLINPEVEVLAGDEAPYDEGCLSVPGFYESVERPKNIILRALDRDGNPYELKPDGLLAVCIQHELDHLNGKLFVDYISNMKRNRIRKKLEKQTRQKGE